MIAPSQKRSAITLTNQAHQKTRYFVEDPIAGWKPISFKRSIAIYRGEQSLPALTGKMLRMATALIDVAPDKPDLLSSVTIANWKIGDDGLVDQADQLRRVIAKLDGDVADDTDAIATDEDVAAIKRYLFLQ